MIIKIKFDNVVKHFSWKECNCVDCKTTVEHFANLIKEEIDNKIIKDIIEKVKNELLE